MAKNRFFPILRGLGRALPVTLLTYFWVIRPWQFRWGATDDEVRRALPGDELSPHPASQATRALTINAPATEVWPWLVQMGQDRGGMYSYTWLENLFRADMQNADRIMPEFQHRKVGDKVWLAPPERYGGQGYALVGAVDPNRELVLITHAVSPTGGSADSAGQGTWSFVLDPTDQQSTRLIVRSRGVESPSLSMRLLDLLFWEPAHFIMERKMMLGIKQRAEATAGRRGEASTGQRSFSLAHENERKSR